MIAPLPPLKLLVPLAVCAVFASASAQENQISVQTFTLPGENVYPEGIAIDQATGDLYVGSTSSGTVYRGKVSSPGELEVFLPGRLDGRTGVTGMKVVDGRLFIAGRNTGRAFVYETASGELVKALETPSSNGTLINDVTVTPDAAYFTDSFRPNLFRASITAGGIGEMEAWLDLRATVIPHGNGFNLNGVAATEDGRYLLTVHFDTGRLYRIDTRTREVVEVDLKRTRLTTGDGLWLEGTTLYVVREAPASVVQLAMTEDFASGAVVATLTHPSLKLPTTVAKYGNRLLVVNSQLDGTPPELPFSVTSLPLPDNR